jgi:glycosyltransferase involved in cell wall biosynthesis
MSDNSPVWGPPDALEVLGFAAGHSGFAHHMHGIVRELVAQGVAVQAGSLFGDPARMWPEWMWPLADPAPGVRLSLQVCPPMDLLERPVLRRVNFTTFEADRVHPDWVKIATSIDRTLVTTRQCWEAWVVSGTPEDRIGIVPLGVDARMFDGSAPSLDVTLPDGTPLSSRRTRFLHVSSAGNRKNQDGLVRAWIEATRPDDDAALVLRIGDAWTGSNNVVRNALRRAERRAGRTLEQAAPVVWLDTGLPEETMPSLFSAATHYLSASHGEGWDLAAIEAAASGLTMIVPDHSAYREYLDPTIATMIPSPLVPNRIDKGGAFTRFFEGANWWEPDHDALVDAIRRAVAGEALPRGAQQRIRTDFTWEASVIRLLGELAIALEG